MADLLMKAIIDEDSFTESNTNTNKILSIAEMKLKNIYILSNRRMISTKNGSTMIATLKDYETREEFTTFIPGSLMKKTNYDNDSYIVILGKKKVNNYHIWDIRVRKIE